MNSFVIMSELGMKVLEAFTTCYTLFTTPIGYLIGSLVRGYPDFPRWLVDALRWLANAFNTAAPDMSILSIMLGGYLLFYIAVALWNWFMSIFAN